MLLARILKTEENSIQGVKGNILKMSAIAFVS